MTANKTNPFKKVAQEIVAEVKSKPKKVHKKVEVKHCESCEDTGLSAVNKVCPICNANGEGPGSTL